MTDPIYAEDLPYWKTSTSGADKWLEKAAVEIERAGGTMLAEGYGSQKGQAAFILRFAMQDELFKVVWPVLESKYIWKSDSDERANLTARKRQAATMLYHDIKSTCVKARALGARIAFFAHLELADGRTAAELSNADIPRFPDFARSETLILVEGEVLDD